MTADSRRYSLRIGDRRIELAEGVSLIGRSSECDIRFDDDSVSRRHAELSCRAGRMFLRDLGSSNGSWVGESRVVDEVELAAGQLLRLGKILAVVEVDGVARCAGCGAELPPTAKFCAQCGRPTSGAAGEGLGLGSKSLPHERPTIRLDDVELERSMVEPEVPAGGRARLAAAVIDLTLVGALLLLIAMPIPLISWIHASLREAGWALSAQRVYRVIAAVVGASSLAAVVAYLAGGWASRGSTIGERAFGLRVVDREGRSPLGWRGSLIRLSALFLVGLPFGLGYLSMFFDRQGRALHDRMTGMRVMRSV